MIVFTFDEDGPHLQGEGVEAAHQTIAEALGEIQLTTATLNAAEQLGQDVRKDIRDVMREINDARRWQKVCR